MDAEENGNRKIGGRGFQIVKRIAIGKSVYTDSCQLKFQLSSCEPWIQLNFIKKSKKADRQEHKIYMDKDIKELKYSISSESEKPYEVETDKEEAVHGDEENNDECMRSEGSDSDDKQISTSAVYDESKKIRKDKIAIDNVLALVVERNSENGLNCLSNTYKPNQDKDISKKFIVIEFLNRDDLQFLLNRISNNQFLQTLIKSGNVSKDGRDEIIESFKIEDEKQRHKKSYLRRVKPDDVILHFPFDATYQELDEAASELTEANGLLTICEEKSDNCQKQNDTFDNVWKHNHILRGEDYVRLKPGEYLNDVLIDFWMTW